MLKIVVTIDGITNNSELEESDDAISEFFRNEEKIPIGKLSKYYHNENLNFLCGSGTSVAVGGSTINQAENPFKMLLDELRSIGSKEEYICQLIKFLDSDDLLEKKV